MQETVVTRRTEKRHLEDDEVGLGEFPLLLHDVFRQLALLPRKFGLLSVAEVILVLHLSWRAERVKTIRLTHKNILLFNHAIMFIISPTMSSAVAVALNLRAYRSDTSTVQP